jgi:tetratricopeptide (TPR) repeat protein
MLTIKKRACAPAIVAAACLLLTGCGPPGLRALHKADRLVQSGKYEDAIAALIQATNLLAKDDLPVQAKAHNLLGLAYHRAGNAARARVCYGEALALDRKTAAEADYNLGCLELEHTNLLAARDAFAAYTTQRTTDWNGYMKLGLVSYHLALQTPVSADAARQLNFEHARKAFETSQRIIATAEAWNDLAVIDLVRHPQPSREAISNAVDKLKTALLRDHRYAPALLNLAILYDPAGPYKLGGVQTAIDAYRQYLTLDPLPPHAAEVGLLVTNLDLKKRFDIQVHTPAPVQPLPTIAPSGAGAVIRSNPPQNTPTLRPAPAPVPANPAPATALSAPKPEEPSPPPPAAGGSASNTRVLPSHIAPSPGGPGVAAAPENAAMPTNPAPVSTVVHKPSLLSRLFGGGSKPAEGGAASATGVVANPVGVTPLPAPHAVPHYAAPPVTTTPGNRAEAGRLASQAAAAEKEARWKDALLSYEEAVKADPSYYDACEALGMVAIKTQDYTVALEALHHALALNPESANARYAYAWTLQKKEFFQDAASQLEQLLAQHPEETRAHLLLGNLYAQNLGQPDFARGHYKKVLEKDPHNDQAAGLRAWLQNNPEP